MDSARAPPARHSGRRVAVTDIEQCRIRGHCAAELADLVAELVENALMYSPPRQPVAVDGRRDGGEYCLTVVDRGLGMTAQRMAYVALPTTLVPQPDASTMATTM
ncbi:ATP-binding protein [Streptomyces puniciscabiei]|uniref:ATP-binding protein n=1 Tax=Streptomyces puniciscabiei TaxID=164348 RepID=UPI0006EB3313|nr:ATP-binding protein [Streptomyces puniciscabiei]